MSISFDKRVLIITFCLVLLLTPSISANDSAAVKSLKLKQLTTDGFVFPWEAIDIVGTSKKTNVVFSFDNNEDADEAYIRSILMKKKGAVRSSNYKMAKKLQIDEGAGGAAFWIGDYKTGYGLFFLFSIADPGWTKATLSVVKFDKNGERTEPYKKRFTKALPEGHEFNSVYLQAQKSGDTIAVVMMAGSRLSNKDPVNLSWFAEFDIEGRTLGKVRKILVPEDGLLKGIHAAAPVWNGKRWLVPFALSHWERTQYPGWTSRIGVDVMVAAAKGIKKDLKSRFVVGSDDPSESYFHIHFLPEHDSKVNAVKNNTNRYLLYAHEQPVPASERTFSYNEFTFYLQLISQKGKVLGAPVACALPQWERIHEFVKGNSYYSGEAISAPIAFSKDEVVIALTRSMDVMSGQARSYEQEIALLVMNRKNGVCSYLTKNKMQRKSQLTVPLLKWIRGKITVLIPEYSKKSPMAMGTCAYLFATY
jgi:hypothetical protein